MTKTRALPGGFAPTTSELGFISAVSGQRAEAQKMLSQLQELADRQFVEPYYIAIHLDLSSQDQTFVWLDRAYEARSFWSPWLRVEPKFDRLRANPRFKDLVRRVGLAS